MVEQAQGRTVEIVYDAPIDTQGRKEFFPSANDFARHFEQIDVATLSRSVAEFCEAFVQNLASIWSGGAPIVVDTIEFTLGLGAKGEIRLIAGVSGELNGGIKIVLERS